MKNSMLKEDYDQMLKEMKKDEEKWKREEYKKVWENIKKSNRFGEVGCGGGLQYILVPKDVQVIAMWNGKVSNENSNTQNETPDTMFLLCHSMLILQNRYTKSPPDARRNGWNTAKGSNG